MSISSSEKGQDETATLLAGKSITTQDDGDDDAAIYTTYKAVAAIIQLNNHTPMSAYLDTVVELTLEVVHYLDVVSWKQLRNLLAKVWHSWRSFYIMYKASPT